MAGPVTVAALTTRIRQRSNNEHTGSSFVTDAEILQLLNTSYGELYGHLVRFGIQTTEELQTITADGSARYDLESNFYSLVDVYYKINGQPIRLTRHDARHRPNTLIRNIGLTYRIVGSEIEFSPIPQYGEYQVYYVPVPANLAASDDTVDGVLGWEEYLVVDCAIKILQKEAALDEIKILLAERERILARIEDEAAAVEMNESWVVGRGDAVPYMEGDYVGQHGYRGSLDFPVKWWRW